MRECQDQYCPTSLAPFSRCAARGRSTLRPSQRAMFQNSQQHGRHVTLPELHDLTTPSSLSSSSPSSFSSSSSSSSFSNQTGEGWSAEDCHWRRVHDERQNQFSLYYAMIDQLIEEHIQVYRKRLVSVLLLLLVPLLLFHLFFFLSSSSRREATLQLGNRPIWLYSPNIAFLLKRMGFENMFIQRLRYSVKKLYCMELMQLTWNTMQYLNGWVCEQIVH